MITYKEVFQLAQDKGYKLLKCKHCGNIELNCLKDGFCQSCYPYENATTQWANGIDTDLLILTLIQKWLRDEHKIDATAFPIAKGIYGWSIDFQEAMATTYSNDAEYCVDQILHSDNRQYSFPDLTEQSAQKWSYEQALLEGIAEALKLI
jgi:hypothetical protein